MARGDAQVTREKLLGAAHDLLAERATVASVSEICARAQVNVAMVRYCFGSKDGLLDALLERVLDGLAGELERLLRSELPPGEQLRRHVAAIVRNYLRYPYVNRLMNERLLSADPEGVAGIARSFALPARDAYAELLAAGRREEGWREIDPTLFFFSLVGLCEFLFSARPLLERGFGRALDSAFVDAFSAHVIGLLTSGVRLPISGPSKTIQG